MLEKIKTSLPLNLSMDTSITFSIQAMDPSVSKIIVHITLMTTSGILSLLADQPSSNIHYLLIPIWLHPTQCKTIFLVNSYKVFNQFFFTVDPTDTWIQMESCFWAELEQPCTVTYQGRLFQNKVTRYILNQDKVLLVCCVETIDCFCRDAWQTWMLVVTLHILSKMLWCLPNMFQKVVEVNIRKAF